MAECSLYRLPKVSLLVGLRFERRPCDSKLPAFNHSPEEVVLRVSPSYLPIYLIYLTAEIVINQQLTFIKHLMLGIVLCPLIALSYPIITATI